MSVTYQTNVGGDQLVSMSIYNPAGQIMHQEVPNSMAQYSFTVKNPGKYMYCFYNVCVIFLFSGIKAWHYGRHFPCRLIV